MHQCVKDSASIHVCTIAELHNLHFMVPLSMEAVMECPSGCRLSIQLRCHVLGHDIMDPCIASLQVILQQFGFRKNLSTDTASSNLINSILLAFNNKLTVGGIFCDLTKAFNSVNHSILLSKLEHYGINDNAFRLIKSYLDDRHQRVLMKNTHSINYFSYWNKIKLGVPQGSIWVLCFSYFISMTCLVISIIFILQITFIRLHYSLMILVLFLPILTTWNLKMSLISYLVT